MPRSELIEELFFLYPDWQTRFHNLREAVVAAKLVALYSAWIKTEEGQKYKATMAGVPDTLARIQKEREAEANSALRFKHTSFGTVFKREIVTDEITPPEEQED